MKVKLMNAKQAEGEMSVFCPSFLPNAAKHHTWLVLHEPTTSCHGVEHANRLPTYSCTQALRLILL
jgi:hypothetical protein